MIGKKFLEMSNKWVVFYNNTNWYFATESEADKQLDKCVEMLLDDLYGQEG